MKDIFIIRKYIIMALVVLASLVLLIRLFYIQVVDDSYRLSADNNVLRFVTQYPARGLIYDRNGRLMHDSRKRCLCIPGFMFNREPSGSIPDLLLHICLVM